MRLFHLLTEDRICLSCKQSLDKHMSTGLCGICRTVPHCPRPVNSKPCKECRHIHVHRDTCRNAEFLHHPEYPGSMTHSHTCLPPEGAS